MRAMFDFRLPISDARFCLLRPTLTRATLTTQLMISDFQSLSYIKFLLLFPINQINVFASLQAGIWRKISNDLPISWPQPRILNFQVENLGSGFFVTESAFIFMRL